MFNIQKASIMPMHFTHLHDWILILSLLNDPFSVYLFFPTGKYKCIFSNKDHCVYCVNIFYRFIFSVCLLSHVNIFHILYWLNCHSFECVYWNFPCNKRQHLNDLTCGLVTLVLSEVHDINVSQKSLEKHMFYFYLLRHYFT